MFEFERAVIQDQIAKEKAVLHRLEEQYAAALTIINERIAALLGRQDADLPNMIRRVEYQRMLKAQVQSALDKLHADEYETITDYLEDSYTDGFVGTMYCMHNQGVPLILPIDRNKLVKAVNIDTRLTSPLYQSLGIDLTKLKNIINSEITRGIASGLMYSDIARRISDATAIPFRRTKLIVRTEAGRIQEQATMDAANQSAEKGADVVKQWSAIRDMRTRDTHRLLDGQIRELKEYFNVHGKKAQHPHGFGDPAEDCNCRCTLLIRARAALDEDELKRLQDIASKHGLVVKDSKKYGKAKAKDFADFKKKYLKAAVDK